MNESCIADIDPDGEEYMFYPDQVECDFDSAPGLALTILRKFHALIYEGKRLSQLLDLIVISCLYLHTERQKLSTATLTLPVSCKIRSYKTDACSVANWNKTLSYVHHIHKFITHT